MGRNYNIAETEWKVMEVLWEHPMLGIREICKKLSYTTWSDSTIKTLVRRLVQKGILGIDDTEGTFRYYPCVDEADCKGREARQFLKRVYHGSVKMMMANLISPGTLSDSETKELLRIIDKMEG